MKALVYLGEQEMVIREEPAPKPSANEVIILISAAAICGSELGAVKHNDPSRTSSFASVSTAATMRPGRELQLHCAVSSIENLSTFQQIATSAVEAAKEVIWSKRCSRLLWPAAAF
jgi:hypothetical protein